MISLDELAEAIRARRALRRLGLDAEPADDDDRAAIHDKPPEPDHRDPPAEIS